MTKAQILIEIAYVIGARNKEFTEAVERTGREVLIDDFTGFVQNLAGTFEGWIEDKDGSELQLLHDYIDEIFSNLEEYLDLHFYFFAK